MNLQLGFAGSRRLVPMRRTQTGSQLLFEHGDVSDGAIIGASRALAGNIGSRDDVNLMAQVIEGQQPVEEHQYAIGQRKIVLGVLADSFELANRVIREVADSARGERRQTGDRCRTMLPQQLLQHRQHAALSLFASLPALQHDVLAAGSHLQVRTRSQECVAPDLLSALYRLQQEGVRLVGGDGEKSRDRRQQVGGDRLDHRDQREVAGQTRKLLVIGA